MDVAFAILVVVVLALLATRRLGWIGLHSREIVFFAVCLGLAPLYVLVWWMRGLALALSNLLAFFAVFAFPVAILFVIGLVSLFNRRPGGSVPALGLAGVIVLALLGHGCVHFVSYHGIR